MCNLDASVAVMAGPAVDSSRPGQGDPRGAAVECLALLLDQLGEVVHGLSDEQYVTMPVGVIRSSIGGHLRHCLDHVRALLGAIPSGLLDYDRRERGTAVERDRTAALRAARELAEELRALPPERLDEPLRVTLMLDAGGRAASFDSTVGREVGFVFSHTIHHNALLGAMVKMLGGEVPERFGYAPATLVAAGSAAAAARRFNDLVKPCAR